MLWEISQNFQKNTCARASFVIKLKVSACNFIKKETLTQVFSREFCKVSKNSFFTRTPTGDCFCFYDRLLESLAALILVINESKTRCRKYMRTWKICETATILLETFPKQFFQIWKQRRTCLTFQWCSIHSRLNIQGVSRLFNK